MASLGGVIAAVLALAGVGYVVVKTQKRKTPKRRITSQSPAKPSGTSSSGVNVNTPQTQQAIETYDFGRFSLVEDFLHSNTAVAKGIDNSATPLQLRAGSNLSLNFLSPLDQRVNGRVRVTSWFRSPKLNTEIGGENGSQHTKGEAVDFYIEGMDRNDTYSLIREMVANGEIVVDQAILYNRNSRGPNVHASYVTRRTNRTKYTYRQANGSYVNYVGQVA